MPDKRTIKVFLASPGDLAIERRAFKDQIDLLNLGFGDGAKVEFVPLGWEGTLATTGRRPQSVINADIDQCDVFILAMHRRWGQPAPDSAYDSYTEEEFHLALNRWKKEKSPEVFVFFKHVDADSMADAGPQLAKVLEFRKELERSRTVLYHHFADVAGFKKEVDAHLRAYAKDELPKADAEPEKVILPIEYLEPVKRAEAKAKREAERAEAANRRAEAEAARAEELVLTIARQAAKYALEGRVEEAREAFAKVTTQAVGLEALSLAFEFHRRTGDLAQAEETLQRWLATSGPDSQTSTTAAAYGNLGVIYQTRGDLDRAEEMHRKALEIEEQLGCRGGMATQYGNLGVLYGTRGDLDRAEEMHHKALEIDEKLGHLEGMAANYGNLGGIYQTRGDPDRAEEMHRKALEIEEKLGHLEGMANQYGNLGLIYKTRGDLDQAEKLYRKVLEIDGKLGRLQSIAKAYGNLGLIYQRRGNLDRAEEMHRKALEIDEKLGRLEGMAANYGNLGLICQTRGDLDRAEQMHRNSLRIDEKLGRLEGMASQYANLGTVFQARGDLKQPRELWTKARNLYAKIGMPHMVAKVQAWIDALPDADDTE